MDVDGRKRLAEALRVTAGAVLRRELQWCNGHDGRVWSAAETAAYRNAGGFDLGMQAAWDVRTDRVAAVLAEAVDATLHELNVWGGPELVVHNAEGELDEELAAANYRKMVTGHHPRKDAD